MSLISLPTAAELRQILSYDTDTGALTWLARDPSWFPHGRWSREMMASVFNKQFAGKAAFTARYNGYAVGTLFRRKVNAHRVIWKMMTGTEADQIDHINRVRDDNRWANLRSVTNLENSHNLGPKGGASGITGVYWRPRDDRWVAMIGVNSKQVYLGCFKAQGDAINARRKAEGCYGFSSPDVSTLDCALTQS